MNSTIYMLPEGTDKPTAIGHADISLSYHDNRFVWPKLERKKFRGKVRFEPIDGPGIRHLRQVVARLQRQATLRMHLRLKRHGKNWRHLKLPDVPNV